MTNFHYNPDLLFAPPTTHALFRDPARTVVAKLIVDHNEVYHGVNYLPEGVLIRDGIPRDLVRSMAIHAEKDAIIQALKYHHYRELRGAVMYVSLEPCDDCRNLMKLFHISDCYFAEYYVPSDRVNEETP